MMVYVSLEKSLIRWPQPLYGGVLCEIVTLVSNFIHRRAVIFNSSRHRRHVNQVPGDKETLTRLSTSTPSISVAPPSELESYSISIHAKA